MMNQERMMILNKCFFMGENSQQMQRKEATPATPPEYSRKESLGAMEE